ncbi:hypothetical protein PHJA_001837500 [Phtheirospermum japonicum]|uniref:Ternary complex factor MIP1 leucine-zipper domain-containing protein n=1 Tax=Phtheirospermum japonicum TaxID=374723 RepID=A0A830CL31_9LAMI|nr:hypothetical protein PHJA_001837500 [Phtheirospermum japonicum]
MNKGVGKNNNNYYYINSKKAPLHPQNGKKKMELQGNKSQTAEKTMANKRRSARERKLALLQDVDNLKKKLRHEENVHRALQRAFTRPLGALPRLPPYLPQYTLELLAEVAVLEEEVVRLEEQIVNFRQGLYQEAVHASSRKSPENPTPSSSKRRHSRSSSQSDVSLGSIQTRPSPTSLSRVASIRRILLSESVADSGSRHCPPNNCGQPQNENGSYKDDDKPSAEKKTKTPVKSCRSKLEFAAKTAKSSKMQCRIVEQAHESSSGSTDDRVLDVNNEANKLSEDILKCLINVFVRLSSSKGKTMDSESFSSFSAKEFNGNNNKIVESDSRDPYCNFTEFKKRDIGTYKYLYVIEARSVDLKRKTNASFLIQRLKRIWIMEYLTVLTRLLNKCKRQATIKVGGHLLNAVMIEHLILRLPYHLKYTCVKSAKNDESTICRTLGLEWSEPLVTFALSCGSWSSPAVRVYTASQIEAELEAAKRDYLQAAIIMSSSNKIIIPKLLDWYLLDFAKNLDALLDWICLQLPDELRDEAVKCLERKGTEPLSQLVQLMPYNFNFRYLIHR